MPFEDVGTTKRRSMTPARVLRIWEAHAGRCINCGDKIDATKQRWFVEHARALSLGGKDEDANCGPAHWECKAEKDADDTARTTKAKHVKQASLGLRPQTLKGQGFQKYEPKRRATTPVEKLQITYRRPTA